MSFRAHTEPNSQYRRVVCAAQAEKGGGSTKYRPGSIKTGPNDAFGHWLDKGLRAIYEPVMEEPIPQTLLDLVNQMNPKQKQKT